MLISRLCIRSIKCRRTALGKLPNSRFLASAAEDKSAHLIAETLYLFGIIRITEALGQVKELLLLLPLRRYSVFDQFH